MSAINLKCGCNEPNCEDNNDLWEYESLNTFSEIVGCTGCQKDEDEDGHLYHPDCFEKKHHSMNDKKKAKHRRTVMKTEEIIALSKEKRVKALQLFSKNLLEARSILHGVLQGNVMPLVKLGSGLARAAHHATPLVEEVSALAIADVIGIGAFAHGVALVLEVGLQAIKWSNGTITSHDFYLKTTQAVVGNLTGIIGSALGAFIGSLILPGLGTIIGGVLGALAGGAANKALREVVKWGFDYNEDSKRADLIVEALHFLDLPVFSLINEDVICSSFRKKSLSCHPDSTQVIAMDDDHKDVAKIQWQLLQHAKDVALIFYKNKHQFPEKCKENVKEKYDKEKREDKIVTFNRLRESLENPITSTQASPNPAILESKFQ